MGKIMEVGFIRIMASLPTKSRPLMLAALETIIKVVVEVTIRLRG